MEQRQKGEQFRVLELRAAPNVPTAPNRCRLLLAASRWLWPRSRAVVLAEMLDASFHSTDDLRAYTTVPVLVSIPRIVTEADPAGSGAQCRCSRWRCRCASWWSPAPATSLRNGNEQLVQLLARGRA